MFKGKFFNYNIIFNNVDDLASARELVKICEYIEQLETLLETCEIDYEYNF